MSTTALPGDVSSQDQSGQVQTQANAVMWKCIEALASMKLTCILFLLGMFVVFVGSLAQARRDVWLVVYDYFRTYVAWVDVADMFPPSMFPSLVDFNWDSLGSLRRIPFPGGWTIGWLMLANLITAHALRFKIRASGGRLLAGLGIIALGGVLTAAVVWTGNHQAGVESANTLLSPMQIWYLMLSVMAVATVVPLGVAFGKSGMSKAERILLGSIGIVLGGVLAYFVIGGEDSRLNLSSMRILWQLLKGTACAVVILIGCNLLFQKRGGIVLIHIGVALLMISELWVGMHAKENLLSITEGESATFMRDTRFRELAIVHRDHGNDQVVAIPEAQLVRAADAEEPGDKVIDLTSLPESEQLPFVIRVERFIRNSRLRAVLPDDTPEATGLGSFAVPVEIDPVTGMDDAHDMSSLKLTLLDPSNGKEIKTLLCAQDVSEMRPVPIAEQATVDGQEYQFYLRFERNYRDDAVELIDVSRTDYVGTSTPRDYRSKIVIDDPDTGRSEEFVVWMNNPLRWNGETFYQSGYQKLPSGKEMTTLSVVRNAGWMLPYIACMIVAVGMFSQFGQTLTRYLARISKSTDTPSTDTPSSTGETAASALPAGVRAAAKAPEDPKPTKGPQRDKSVWPIAVPVALVMLSAAWLGSKARPPKDDPKAMNLYNFAQIPVAWRGRPQPIDSVARTELLMISHKSTFKGEMTAAELDQEETREKLVERIHKYWPSVKPEALDGFAGSYEEWIQKVMQLTSSGQEAVEEKIRDKMIQRMPAIRWFLDVVARPELAARHRVIKIDNDQVLSKLDLPKRPGLAYSLAEVEANISALEKERREGMKLEMAEQKHRMSQLQRRAVSLFRKVSRINTLHNLFMTEEPEGLLRTVDRAHWVLDKLGDVPEIMAVPTGITKEQRSWETLIGAGVIRNVAIEFRKAGLTDKDEVVDHVRNAMAPQIVASNLERSIAILKSQYEEIGLTLTPEKLKQRAQDASSGLAEDDPFLSKVLALAGKAEVGASAEDMMSGLSPEEIREIAALSSEVTEVRSMVDDLDDRAGTLIFSEAGTFDHCTDSLAGVFAAWKSGDVSAFNSGVTDYRKYLADNPVPHLTPSLLNLETFFNLFEPFMKSIYLYITVLLLSFFSWIVWPTTLRRSGFWLMGLAFAVHTVALLMRMQISGRPPVTNLYSSAIFIGWAVVGASFAIERLLKNGIGNILGAAVGSATLVIAHYLARDEGDTLGVMQAVLDTTFWLATHVVCITLGYAATFLAGAMAIAYCWIANFASKESKAELPQLGKMIYGVLCFAVFFSLVGTVLGGLWADDSWGRFWGWDPKENGAMLIVMWNAVILHARWDKMVKDYGTAVLAMFGNIVTAWSWFGVNELSAGLHNYGFTEGRLLALIAFVSLQAIFIGGALIPVIGRSANKRIDPV